MIRCFEGLLLFTVREGRVLGVLEVSRSIGDGRFKRCGVSCVPDVMRCTITDNDRYYVAQHKSWTGIQVVFFIFMKDIDVKILKVVVSREECNFLTRPPKKFVRAAILSFYCFRIIIDHCCSLGFCCWLVMVSGKVSP